MHHFVLLFVRFKTLPVRLDITGITVSDTPVHAACCDCPSAANVCAKETDCHFCKTSSAKSLRQLSVFLPGLGLLPQHFFIFTFRSVLFYFVCFCVFVVCFICVLFIFLR